MIQVQETLDADFKRVKDELNGQLNLCIVNGKHNLVFNVEQHSVLENQEVYRTIRKKLRNELRTAPRIRKIRIQKLETIFGCHCHQYCTLLHWLLNRLCGGRRKEHCGVKCCKVQFFCFSDVVANSCPQNKARREYFAYNDTSLLVIETQPYCETHTLNSSPSLSNRSSSLSNRSSSLSNVQGPSFAKDSNTP